MNHMNHAEETLQYCKLAHPYAGAPRWLGQEHPRPSSWTAHHGSRPVYPAGNFPGYALRRIEQGDSGAASGAYLTALLALGLADRATPALPAELWQGGQGERVKLSRQEKGRDDDEYF